MYRSQGGPASVRQEDPDAERMGRIMKLLTMNTHSLVEPDFEIKRECFARMILKEQPDLFAMQEVNQTAAASIKDEEQLAGFLPCPGSDVPVREDNYAAWLAERLFKEGLFYYWTWVPAKLGYDCYDEGMAVFSRRPIEKAEQFFTSRLQDYHNWKTRKVLGIQTGNSWYYTVHMGWWDDDEEPFASQWNRLETYLFNKKQNGQPVWLMGDFNSSSTVRGQGYDLVIQSDWRDTFANAEEKDTGITVEEVIDGWKERSSELECEGVKGMRLDYIFSSRPVQVLRSQVVCNGKYYEKVSDHYGVMVETKDAGEEL